MSCKIYLVRHGETEWNREGRVQGHTDIVLSDVGREQAEALALAFRDIPFNAAYSSDLSRAYETAVAVTTQKKISLQKTVQLRERFWGKWEGETFEKIRAMNCILDGVETYTAAGKRIADFLCEVAAKHLGEKLLIVTHGGAMKGLLMHLRVPDVESLAFHNTCHFCFESDGKTLFFNRDSNII